VPARHRAARRRMRSADRLPTAAGRESRRHGVRVPARHRAARRRMRTADRMPTAAGRESRRYGVRVPARHRAARQRMRAKWPRRRSGTGRRGTAGRWRTASVSDEYFAARKRHVPRNTALRLAWNVLTLAAHGLAAALRCAPIEVFCLQGIKINKKHFAASV
jgi:hypothetical protein